LNDGEESERKADASAEGLHGQAAGSRWLIVNADDFGLSSGVNRGVIAAHERGIVTSASLMVRSPAAEEAVAYSGSRPGLSLGLHVDLGEWVYRDGVWETAYEVAPTTDEAAVRAEVARQLEAFHRLVGSPPTHLDSHQHVHRSEPVRSVLREAADRIGVPLRGESDAVRYCGDFYGQTGEGEPIEGAVSAERLIGIVRALPPGITELGCHPGEGGDVDSVYREERELELAALCDPRVLETVRASGVRLCSFADYR
jgi:predicted glycoside hydrolase/deacetylase ChbG (UPF0249 family)